LEVQRSLTGIFNVFKDIPDFSTSFNILRETGKYNIISDFFDPKDFEFADHHIRGKIDENGMFNGTIRVFQQTFQYTFRPIRKPGKTPYGPLDLELGQMEGASKASMLSEEQYDLITSKTEKYGGLYIYRDRFRVLPYGRTDYDFLRFEERRSKKAGYYFFSHRNMFGYISITRNGNSSLKDKAGREGLIENKAYKELKEDLIALFIDIAKNFLKSTEYDEVNARSEQLDAIRQKHYAILEAEKKRNRQTKANFTKQLKANQEEIRFIEQEIISLQAELNDKAELLNLTYEQYQELSNSLLDRKEKLRSLKLISPKRVSLSSTQERKFAEYQAVYSSICENFELCENTIAKIRKRFDVQNLKRDFENQYMYSLREISTLTNQYIFRVSTIADSHKAMLLNEGRGFTEQFKQLVSESIPPMNIPAEYEAAIKQVALYREDIKTKIDNRFTPFVSHLESLSLDIDEEVILEWYQSKYQELEERLAATNELAQLGISAEIIDHELYSLHAQMANSLGYFKEYSRDHTETAPYYKQLSVAFEHMEANYKMLQPLYRTAKRQRTVFTGNHIMESMRTFFSQRIKDLEVKIESTDDFDNYEFFTYESVIYSVFINIINNALYWLIPSQNRVIRMEYLTDTNEILIMNNGEKINDKIIDDIFTLFFTRKHNGRGIGLYLAKQSLKSIGMDIYATNAAEYNRLDGACFIINLNAISL
ncbi:MAG: ATP-binding protein, partial [Muribaculum sp.]|nr:ATP-binding protein [Muribaculum sp.]